VRIALGDDEKTLDYMLYNQGRPLTAVEVNFYSTSGSKPSEVLTRAYPDLQESLRAIKLPLVVITDGKGWRRMQKVIHTAYERLDYVFNLRLAQRHLPDLLRLFIDQQQQGVVGL